MLITQVVTCSNGGERSLQEIAICSYLLVKASHTSWFYSGACKSNWLSRTLEATGVLPTHLCLLALIVVIITIIIHMSPLCPGPGLLIAPVNQSGIVERCR